MAFLDRFFNLKLSICEPNRGVDFSGLVRFPLYEDESFEIFLTKLIAFIHSFEDGLTQVKSESEDRLEFFKSNIVGDFEKRVSVGLPDATILRHAIKHYQNARFAVYFSGADEPQEFAKRLKGSRSNWISTIDFFAYPAELVREFFSAALSQSSVVSATSVDGVIYFESDGHSFTGSIEKLDMWGIFQEVIAKPDVEKAG